MRRAGWSRRRRWAALVLALYIVLLAASHTVRATRPPSVPALGSGQRIASLAAVDEGGLGNRTVRVVYEDHGPREGAPVLIALHGSPGSLADFRRMLPYLESELRVLTVDLPGFGKSELEVPDYGVDAHAVYVRQLMDSLGVEAAHLIGFSMGGGVALELAEDLGPRARSLTLMAAIGVQELELMGDYHLNHAVHGLQLSALWLAREGLPHFGTLDGAFLGVPYARNFYDTDQRPLRAILEGLELPVLVLHSPDDPLVPIEAAREHARIAPQAELVEIDVRGASGASGEGAPPAMIRGHLLPFLDAELVAPRVLDFVERVEAGAARTRTDAEPARVARAAEPFEAVPLGGMGLLIAMALIAAATLVSEDLTCIATGALVAQGRIDLASGALACFLGIYVGDLLLFLAGRLFGARALGAPPLSWVLEGGVVERAGRWFDKRGLSAIFLTRFMPGTRLPTYFAAGALRTNSGLFAIYFAIAAGVWTPILVWLSSLIGGNLQRNVELFERALPLGLLATIVVGLLVVKVLVPLCTWRGRRMLLGSIKRKLNWEFWPPWIFYPRIVLYVLWRGLRAGRLTAFCASNPGIPNGGFIGESKSQILGALAGAEEAVPTWELIGGGDDAERRVAALERFVDESLGGRLPVVLKPDVGQRGSGVLVARELEAARDYVRSTTLDLIVQAYVEGSEYGLFYARRPSEAEGRVVSVTVKRPATVVGDGRSTLEQLILSDRRAVSLARVYLRRNAARLDQVPARDERVAISDLGTHALGAVFTDGAQLVTPELEAAVDRIAKAFDGFYFGRFDVRVPDERALKAGRELAVIELNGVTSEMTHVYDRKHSVWFAWSTILAQWDLAFEIAAENRARGVEAPTLYAVLIELWRYRRAQKQHRA